MSTPPTRAPDMLDVTALVGDRAVRIIVCCGAGGVGKTTTAAALGVLAAESGRRAVVMTIDPARRLAQSLGLSELGNVPAPIPGVDTSAGGSLDAMMLDMKRTFDEVVIAHAEPAKAQAILENPFYEALSSSFAGTQEYMAMEKLGQLHALSLESGTWDLIIVDTPPARSALDFLDAPKRLGAFLDGRLIRILGAPARAGGRAYMRLVAASLGVFSNVLSRIVGAAVLRDLQTFVASFDALFGGFRERADATYSLLADESTRFVVVAAPEPDALREASYFVERLEQDGMPLAGLILNRVIPVTLPALTAELAGAGAQRLLDLDPDPESAESMIAGLLALHEERMIAAARQDHLAARFVAGHPSVAIARVPALPQDVHDLAGLRQVGACMAAPDTSRWAPASSP